jgi:exopolysaccharide production protein ExoQ
MTEMSMAFERARPGVPISRTIGDAVPLFAKVNTYALLLALFLFATGGAFLVPSMEEHAKGAATVVAATAETGPLHLLELALAFAISLKVTLSNWRTVASASVQMKLFSASALLATLSCLWSVDPLLSLRSGLYLLFNTLFMYYLVQRFPLQELMRLMIAAGTVVAMMSIATAILLPSYAWGSAGSHFALQGAFIAKNVLGNVAVFLLTPALFVRGMRLWARTTYILVMLALIVLSFSVQAWAAALFCFCFAAICMVFGRLSNKEAKWIAFVTLLPVVVAAMILVTSRMEILEFLGKDPTLSGRTIIWNAVLRSVLKRPMLGWGYNAFWQRFSGESGLVLLQVHFPIAQSQNGALEVLLGLGGVGLALVVATFLQGIRNVVKCFRLGATEAARWYLLIVLLTIGYSVGEANIQQSNMLPWMMYIMACTGLAAEVRRAREERMAIQESAKLQIRGPRWNGPAQRAASLLLRTPE